MDKTRNELITEIGRFRDMGHIKRENDLMGLLMEVGTQPRYLFFMPFEAHGRRVQKVLALLLPGDLITVRYYYVDFGKFLKQPFLFDVRRSRADESWRRMAAFPGLRVAC